jgi:lipopolysaccharide/colanic/teichoic acid biosynthesis glycosyltransferase
MIVGEDVQQRNCKKPLLDREEVLRSSKKYWFVRRAQDLLLSSVALLLLWPIMLVVALLIVIDDPKAGPIFAQTRIGRDGKPFKFYKFRSMCANAEEKLQELLDQNEMEGPVFKIKEDPRITRVGKFIRKTSLYELPQLWNVFIGDMSIVGPRPGLPREVVQYDDYARQRLLVQPGLTCFWQVQKNRNQLSFEEWLELDIKYIRERSFVVDWKIMFATIATVFRMDGE